MQQEYQYGLLRNTECGLGLVPCNTGGSMQPRSPQQSNAKTALHSICCATMWNRPAQSVTESAPLHANRASD